MPSDIPHVDEIGATSAPLKSASFFIGAKCTPYNDDFMLCKAENAGKDESPCLAAGRKVTRCASHVISSIQSNCLEQFNTHWQCLENQNQDFKNCRPAERLLNKCVFDKMGLKKKVPGTIEGKEPWNKKKAIYRPFKEDLPSLNLQSELSST